jgi:hypothetical protein
MVFAHQAYTDLTWAEDTATLEATGAPTQRPEWLGAVEPLHKPGQPFWRESNNPRGLRTESPRVKR